MNLKKVMSLILALILSACLFTACGETTELPEGMQLVASEFVDYKFYVPTDWIPDTSIDGFLSAKAADNSTVSVQVMTRSNPYPSADAYFREDYFKKLQSTFQNVTLLEEECSVENQTLGKDKVPASKYVYTMESDGAVYKIMQYFSYNGVYLYIVTYTGKISDTVNGEVKEVSHFTDHLEEVSSIVENFVF